MMQLSSTTEKFKESVIREMTRVAKQYPDCINLAQGFPDFAAPKPIKDAAIDAINKEINQYAITWGSKNLRNALAKKVMEFNGLRNIDPEKNITVTCGATEAMMSALRAIINPGDEIIIFEPFYENYGPDCLLSGAEPKFIPLNFPDWSFDEDRLAKIFTKKTKAIIINTPNNPTGKVFNEKELKFIANLCLQHDVIAVTDEIYEHILFDNTRHISIGSLPEMDHHSITINSISKTYSLTGWRVGWAIADAKITAEIKKVHDFLTVGAAAPLQEAAVTALSMSPEYYQWLHDFYEHARDEIYHILCQTPLHPIKPKGAYYIMTDCRDFMQSKNIKTSLELALYLVKEVGIASVPGSSFYSNPSDGDWMTRFCFCKKPETLQLVKMKFQKII